MTSRPHPRDVKRIVALNFFDLGASMPSLFRIRESAVRGPGKSAARIYRADDFSAVWHIEQGVVRFRDEEGNILRTVTVDRRQSPCAAAA